MIDLHCHLLPGVDDGPTSLEESVALARAAYQDGVRAIVVTPHGSVWLEQHAGTDLRAALRVQVQDLEKALHQAGIPLALYPGMEVELELDLPERLRAGRAQPLADGPYFLLELPLQRPLYLEQVVFQVQVEGWRPVVAHAERYPYVQQDPALLAPLVQRGLIVQVTAGSLLGLAGRGAKDTARRLLRGGLVHCLASDGHAATGPRAPLLARGVEVAARIVGTARARAMVTDVPQAILEGRQIGAW